MPPVAAAANRTPSPSGSGGAASGFFGSGGDIDAYDATSPEDRDAILRLLHHLQTLQVAVHMPYLDSLVIDKYVVAALAVFAEPPPPSSSQAGDEGYHSTNMNSTATSLQSTTNEEAKPARNQQQSAAHRCFKTVQDAKIARDSALANVVALVNMITDHKQRTLEVLEAVSKRDAAWSALTAALLAAAGEQDGAAAAGGGPHDNKGCNNNNGPNDGATAPSQPVSHTIAAAAMSVEFAAMVQHHLYRLQKATLDVVEAIGSWRAGLSLPHPFMVGPDNYLLRIVTQTFQLSQDASMARVIPMQSMFMQYPLCSNLPSLARFAEDPSKPNLKSLSRLSKTSYGPVCDGGTTKRLQAAERVIMDEVETQIHVVQQLLELCQSARFLPVLNLRKLYPKAYVGATSGSGGKSTGLAPPQPGGKRHVGAASSSLRGIPLYHAGYQRKLELQLLHALDVLRTPSFRPAYDEACNNDSKKKQQDDSETHGSQ